MIKVHTAQVMNRYFPGRIAHQFGQPLALSRSKVDGCVTQTQPVALRIQVMNRYFPGRISKLSVFPVPFLGVDPQALNPNPRP